MSALAPIVEGPEEHAGLEESGPTTLRETGRPGRGSVLANKYRLEMLLGEGGMAFVWSAYNLELELPVAVKLLRSGLKDELLTQRLRNEARAAARLVHPNIVRVFDVAVANNGDPFIVMELLTGHSLADELRRGRMAAVRAVQLLLPIADALALAHAHGNVHRDLKPDNVFLSTENDELQPKLLDFGIAKLAHASVLADKLTEKGTTLGSPNYMSPEQVLGEDVDQRSDIWSFCVVLYKAIAGVAPFHSADKRVTLDSILTAEPSTLALRAGVDEELSSLVHWGLAKDPTKRPASMRELGAQLARWLRRQGVYDEVTPAPLPPKWLTRHALSPSNDGLEARAEPAAASVEREQHTQRIGPRPRRAVAPLAALAALLVVGGVVFTRMAGPQVAPAAARARAPRSMSAVPAITAPSLPAVTDPGPPPVTLESAQATDTDAEASELPPSPPQRLRTLRRKSAAEPSARASRLPF
jgi:serine/threonine-protein kinase